MHKRLTESRFSTRDAGNATLFFIPLYIPQLCMPEAYTRFEACGVDFSPIPDSSSASEVQPTWAQTTENPWTRLQGTPEPDADHAEAVWRWLLQQESFQKSDGSDHFIVVARPWEHVASVRPCSHGLSLVASTPCRKRARRRARSSVCSVGGAVCRTVVVAARIVKERTCTWRCSVPTLARSPRDCCVCTPPRQA